MSRSRRRSGDPGLAPHRHAPRDRGGLCLRRRDVRGAIATALSEFATYVLARVPVAPAADVTIGAPAPGLEASKAMSETKPDETVEKQVTEAPMRGRRART